MALINDPNYKKLEGWYKANASNLKMRDMFDADKDRFSKFRLEETLWSHVKVDMVVVVGRGGGRDADGVNLHFGSLFSLYCIS